MKLASIKLQTWWQNAANMSCLYTAPEPCNPELTSPPNRKWNQHVAYITMIVGVFVRGTRNIVAQENTIEKSAILRNRVLYAAQEPDRPDIGLGRVA